MKKILLIVILGGSFFIIQTSIIHAQIPLPFYFQYPYQFGYFGPFNDPSRNTFSFSEQPKGIADKIPSSNQPIYDAYSLQQHYQQMFYHIVAFPSHVRPNQNMYPSPLNFDGTDIFMIVPGPSTTAYLDILNPFGPNYYLNPSSPYYGIKLPEKGTIGVPLERTIPIY